MDKRKYLNGAFVRVALHADDSAQLRISGPGEDRVRGTCLVDLSRPQAIALGLEMLSLPHLGDE